jgi:hypothetical protein
MRPRPLLVLLLVALALTLAGCGEGSSSSSRCGLEGEARCRPEQERVDRARPTFSHPTRITNPRFPMNDQVIQLGQEGGKRARNEITRYPATKTIEWEGEEIDTVVQQFVAYQDERVVEVALDYFAQADDGSVWYLGEHVSNYENGVVVDHEGTWIAGEDGDAGMIMPARPRVGAVYRPENIPGLVFEEDVIEDVGVTVEAPRGPVRGAIVVREHLMDGSFETKTFAPGYGEFRVQTGDELIQVALAAPVDARRAPRPAELQTLADDAAGAFEAAGAGDWTAVAAGAGDIAAAARRLRDLAPVPRLLDAQLADAEAALGRARAARDPAAVRSAALDVARATLDLDLRHRPVREVDVDRLGVWARQVLVDAAAGDRAAVKSDVVVLERIRDRGRAAVAVSGRATSLLRRLRLAANGGNLAAAAAAASGLTAALKTR